MIKKTRKDNTDHTHGVDTKKDKGTTSKDMGHTHTYDWSNRTTSKVDGHTHVLPLRD